MSQSPSLSKKRSISVQDRMNISDVDIHHSIGGGRIHKVKSTHKTDKIISSPGSRVLQSEISIKNNDVDDGEVSQENSSFLSKKNLTLLQTELE